MIYIALREMETFRHVGCMPWVSVLSMTQNCPSLSFHSLHVSSPTTSNQHNQPHSSPPAPNTNKYKPYVRRLIAGFVDMICPNFVPLMCIHASAQTVKDLLAEGADPDDGDHNVRICAVKGSVSVHTRLVVSRCVVCRCGARCAGSGATSPMPMQP